jgi:hypothetical protein
MNSMRSWMSSMMSSEESLEGEEDLVAGYRGRLVELEEDAILLLYRKFPE